MLYVVLVDLSLMSAFILFVFIEPSFPHCSAIMMSLHMNSAVPFLSSDLNTNVIG